MKSKYKLTVSGLLEDPEWDAFVAGTPGGHHVQTSRWAKVKSFLNWKAIRITVTDDKQIFGGAQILMRSLPLTGNIGYVTKGPLFSHKDPYLVEIVLDKIIQISRQNRCQFMAIQPPNDGKYLCSVLESLKFCTSNLELAPTASLVIDLRQGQEIIKKQMRRETRRNIHRSERAGVSVCEGDESDLDIFYSLYLKTAQRQGFVAYNRKYFDIMWQNFAPLGWIALLIVRCGNEAVSSQLLIPFGDTVITKMIGWSGVHSKCYPNDALLWASILWAEKHGYKYFDFEGLDPMGARAVLNGQKMPEVPSTSKDIIKYGYGGKVVLYPPVYDFVPNKTFNWFYRRIQNLTGGNLLYYRFAEHLRKR